ARPEPPDRRRHRRRPLRRRLYGDRAAPGDQPRLHGRDAPRVPPAVVAARAGVRRPPRLPVAAPDRSRTRPARPPLRPDPPDARARLRVRVSRTARRAARPRRCGRTLLETKPQVNTDERGW